MTPEEIRERNGQVAEHIRQSAITSKWVSLDRSIPLVFVSDYCDDTGTGAQTINFFDFSGGKAPLEQQLAFQVAFGNLLAVLEKSGSMKRPYRVILVAGEIPQQEEAHQ